MATRFYTQEEAALLANNAKDGSQFYEKAFSSGYKPTDEQGIAALNQLKDTHSVYGHIAKADPAPAKPAKSFIDLSNWNLTLPRDEKGNNTGIAQEIPAAQLSNYRSEFFGINSDGSVTTMADVVGATTSGTKYARSEFREMTNGGKDRAAWKLDDGGVLTATLRIDEAPQGLGTTPGRMVIGQIHGKDDELCRLYYSDGGFYFVNDLAAGGKETSFPLVDGSGNHPKVGLGESFDYRIDLSNPAILVVHVNKQGISYVGSCAVDRELWKDDEFYFKAGVYLNNADNKKVKNGKGRGKATFTALDAMH